jgi:hypothetical protein
MSIFSSIVIAQTSRTDGIWARSTAGAKITLDGKLDEAAWQKAETIYLKWAQNTGDPTSGWYAEDVGLIGNPSDPIDATIKFLVDGDKLYIGFDIKDKSIGGSPDWNKYDGLLMHMNQKNNKDPNNHLPAVREAFYTWWDPSNTGISTIPGGKPWQGGSDWWGNWSGTRPDSMKNRWDAACVVHGIVNSDTLDDTNYVVEMMFNLKELGYNATDAKGDIVEWTCTIFDGDYYWPLNANKKFTGRAWWECPWSYNDDNVIRIYVRPDVTINSTSVPTVDPDYTIPNGSTYSAPKVDGKLDEAIWSRSEVKAFTLKYGDEATRTAYPGVGPTRSGWQITSGTATIIGDPANATAKWFFKDNWLYVGVDVSDKFVQGSNTSDKEDGVILSLYDRSKRTDDNRLQPYSLHIALDSAGKVVYLNDLKKFVDTGWVKAGLSLKSGTTVNNYTDIDQGYTVEFAIDLTKFGYPTSRGDGIAFLGLCVNDGDSFDNPADNYGTSTWWFKQPGTGAPAWCYMDPSVLIPTSVSGNINTKPEVYTLHQNYPNPFNPSTVIKYDLPRNTKVVLKIYNYLGQEVKTLVDEIQPAGKYTVQLDGKHFASGLYFYSLSAESFTDVKKMLLIK